MTIAYILLAASIFGIAFSLGYVAGVLKSARVTPPIEPICGRCMKEMDGCRCCGPMGLRVRVREILR